MNREETVSIAEVSSNHNGSLERALDFVKTAAAIGCGAVKFQLFKLDELFAPEILMRSEEHRRRRAWELPLSFLPVLAEQSRESGILFGCTPFYIEAVEELSPYVDFFKVASYELLWHDLLRACASTDRPLMLSTGMGTMDEIDAAVAAVRGAGCDDLTLLHCTSGYPTPPDECNLAAIATLRRAFGCRVGWSDHSVSRAVVSRAVRRWQAKVVEFHLDLDGQGAEFGGGHCWLPDPMAEVIAGFVSLPTCAGDEADDASLPMDGTGRKHPVPSELSDREWRADPSDGLRPLRKLRAGFAVA